MFIEIGADLSANGKPRRHGQANRGHFRKVRAFTSNSSRMVALPSVFLPKAYTNLGLRFGEDFLLVFLNGALAIGRNYLFISLKNQGAKQSIGTPCGAPIRVIQRFKLAKGPASYWWALLPGSKLIPDAGAENNALSWQKLGAGLL